MGLELVWLATALAGTPVVATAVLVARMDEILASAVSQGRAFPFTGEAGDQSVLPVLLGYALTALFLTTAALGYLLRGWAYHDEHIGLALPAAAPIIVIVLCAPLVAPVDLAHQQYTHDLYGWWYFPFLIASGCRSLWSCHRCHAGCDHWSRSRSTAFADFMLTRHLLVRRSRRRSLVRCRATSEGTVRTRRGSCGRSRCCTSVLYVDHSGRLRPKMLPCAFTGRRHA